MVPLSGRPVWLNPAMCERVHVHAPHGDCPGREPRFGLDRAGPWWPAPWAFKSMVELSREHGRPAAPGESDVWVGAMAASGNWSPDESLLIVLSEEFLAGMAPEGWRIGWTFYEDWGLSFGMWPCLCAACARIRDKEEGL